MSDISKYRALFLSESRQYLDAMQKSLVALENDPDDKEHIDEFFRAAHSIKGMAAAMGYSPISALSHACEDLMDAVRAGQVEFGTVQADALLNATTVLEDMVRAVEAEGEIQPADELLEQLRVLTADAPRDERPRLLIPDLPASPPKPKAAAPAKKSVNVQTDLLDRLIDGLGEILAVREVLRSESRIAQNPRLYEAASRLDRAVVDLRDDIVASRMSPLSLVLDRLPLIARNVARARAKEIETVVTGAEIEIDRSILEGLDQPLMHIIRNCADHGIEPSTVRTELGKPAKGHITIAVRREKDLVFIDVTDDGKGMDPESIVATAIEAGIVTADSAERLTRQQKLELVCEPGLSTRNEVTDVSGRGVGMDAARSMIHKFGGNLSIQSTLGEGTTITLTLPRLLALMEVILVAAAGERFAVPLSRVERTVELPIEALVVTDGQRHMSIGDELIPFRAMSDMFHTNPTQSVSRVAKALLIEGPGGTHAVGVDEITGMREVVVKPLAAPLAQIDGLAGVTLIDGAEPVFVVEPQKLL